MSSIVAICGNIGVGKSSLSAKLSSATGWVIVDEPTNANPYLADFYDDMHQWAFHSQLRFLLERVTSLLNKPKSSSIILLDRSVEEDIEVFARHLFNGGFISPDDWQTYLLAANLVTRSITKPVLYVYLRAPIALLAKRIAKRARKYEAQISESYLDKISQEYERWAASLPPEKTLVIDAEHVDFLYDVNAVSDLAASIQQRLQAAPSLPITKGSDD